MMFFGDRDELSESCLHITVTIINKNKKKNRGKPYHDNFQRNLLTQWCC